MQAEEYNLRGKELVDYITKYLSTIQDRRVIPDVKPGYMTALIPERAPAESEDWDAIFEDFQRVVMPGVVHWQSPHMHAYYPSLTSWPSLLGDMLADAINCVGFTWASSPACTELEMKVMDWLCRALGLPDFFLHQHRDSRGGGVLQSTVSESTLVALLAARKDKILQLDQDQDLDLDLDPSVLNSTLVAYASDQAHSSVEKAGHISLVKIRFLPTDHLLALRGDTLRRAVQEDRRRGLLPFLLCATLGTTGVCAFDALSELGPVCAEEGLWLHVDAAYAGSAYLCPELRWSLEGIQFADSFVFNPSKWMMVHFDCTAFWVKDKLKLQQTFSVDPVYLRHDNSQVATDFMNWQIPLSRRFRSLKLWFVLRSFGLKKLQAHIRHGIDMAKLLESLIRSEPHFDIPAQRHLGLVVFCLKAGNALTQELLRRLTCSGTMYLIPAEVHSKRILRFTVTSQFTTADHIRRDWGIISKIASGLLGETAGPDQVQLGAGVKADDEATEETTPRMDKAQVELWIDKTWNRSRRPMRSLSCNSEPYGYLGLRCGHAFESKLSPQEEAGVLSTSGPAGGKQAVKKLTKFYSVPSFCNQWTPGSRHHLCCPLKVSQAPRPSSCRRLTCIPPSSPSDSSTPDQTLVLPQTRPSSCRMLTCIPPSSPSDSSTPDQTLVLPHVDLHPSF
ncbi:histidine decarboxylase [Entelurus aequoreus]|uniref:histidine decarboxylase n=1 Tax=Entelurus aequoreus TaxID=161455 RepID=UPI002B1CE5FC|nr:histidine decarboxylase [Entelurus aequoreus]